MEQYVFGRSSRVTVSSCGTHHEIGLDAPAAVVSGMLSLHHRNLLVRQPSPTPRRSGDSLWTQLMHERVDLFVRDLRLRRGTGAPC